MAITKTRKLKRVLERMGRILKCKKLLRIKADYNQHTTPTNKQLLRNSRKRRLLMSGLIKNYSIG
jgi:hypothetical protein